MVTLARKERSSLLIRSLKSSKWELDLSLYFFLALIIVGPAALSEREVTASFTQLWHWILVKIAQVFLAYIFYRTIRNLCQSMGLKQLYLHQLMLIGFAGGSASAIIVYLTLNFTNFLDTQRSDLSFFISTGVVGMIWLPVCSVTSQAFKKSTQMNELINLKLSIDVTNEIKQSEDFRSAIANNDRITSNQLFKIIENSKGKSLTQDDLSKARFKRAIYPSHFEDKVTNFFTAGIKFISMYKYSNQNKPLNPLYFTFVFVFIIAFDVIKNSTPFQAFVIISYFAVYTYFFHASQMFFYRKLKNWIWLVNLCDLLNMVALTVTGYLLEKYYNFFALLNTSMTATYAIVIVLYTFLNFTGHIAQSAIITYQQRKQNLEKYINSDSFKLEVLTQELEKDELKWGQLIHGRLQSKILSHSISEMNELGSQVLGDRKFAVEVKELITQFLATTSHSTADPTQIIEQVSKPWGAVIDIQSEIDQSIAKQKLSPLATQTVTDVLEEAITNAVKHGGAEKVWLIVKSKSSNTLKLEVRNDGSPMGTAKRQSAGTKLFNQSGVWSISNKNGLVVFKIQIAI